MQLTEAKGQLAGARVVRDGYQVMLISTGGTVIRMPVDGIKRIGRATQGVIVMRLRGDESVSSLAPVVESEETEPIGAVRRRRTVPSRPWPMSTSTIRTTPTSSTSRTRTTTRTTSRRRTFQTPRAAIYLLVSDATSRVEKKAAMAITRQADLLEPINLADHLDKLELYLGQVCQIAGISKMQLDYWTNKAQIPTKGKKQRIYDVDALETVMLIKQAKDKGLNLGAAIDAARKFRELESART